MKRIQFIVETAVVAVCLLGILGVCGCGESNGTAPSGNEPEISSDVPESTLKPNAAQKAADAAIDKEPLTEADQLDDGTYRRDIVTDQGAGVVSKDKQGNITYTPK